VESAEETGKERKAERREEGEQELIQWSPFADGVNLTAIAFNNRKLETKAQTRKKKKKKGSNGHHLQMESI